MFAFRIAIIATASLFAPYSHAEDVDFFETKIRPVLVERCFKCHSTTSEKVKGGLLMDSRVALLKGGDTRAALVPGDPDKSLLIEAIRYTNTDLQMPPKGKLSAQEIADLTTWVKNGAIWPNDSGPKVTSAKNVFDLEKRKQAHWSWKPIANVTPPKVTNTKWPASSIDKFVLAKLEEKKLQPAPAAEPRTLLRRLYFDLVGLPPSPAEVEAFVKECEASFKSPIEKVVDHLLASPRFGERWARHWLDLVRYAETRGHEFEPIIPNAWQYRDYVIRALNADVPYDRFVTEHIAGDLVAQPRLSASGANESILGTGFWFLGEEVHSPVDIRQDECDRMDNRLDVMAKTFLGLTVACARCHDHKFDAISQRDYYSLQGFLISSSYRQVRFETIEMHRRIAHELDQLRSASHQKLAKQLAIALRPGVEKMTAQILAARAPASVPAESATEQRARWQKEFEKAKIDLAHPLHSIAKLPSETSTGKASAKPSTAVIDAAPKLKTTRVFAAEDVVADFTKSGATPWLQDGFAFGFRPARVGELRFAANAEQPIVGLVTRDAAWRDAVWNKLKVTGSEKDGGKISEWERGEQTLRTPEFALKTGRLWYLVKGPGRAYAVVNSHLVIHGPLHGATLKEWKGDAEKWHWIEHKLDTYAEHRAHIEFSPVGTNDFAVAMVVQSEPQEAAETPAAAFVPALGNNSATSLEALASNLQAISLRALSQLEAGQLIGAADAPELACIADWLVRNLDWFCPPGSDERVKYLAAVKDFTTKHSELVAKIQNESHTAPAILDGNGMNEFLLVRGQSKSPAAPAQRRFLEAISTVKPVNYGLGSGRLQLAQQLTDPANPFTSRVIVNRVWQHLFGRGLVPSVDNFGVLGQPPSHQELLDYLAARFMRENNWSLKQLIRELVLSRTYQMASAPGNARAEEFDPENILLHRANVRRLEGEAIRDTLLTVSGRLDEKAFGPSVPVHITAFMDGRGKPKSGPLDGDGRRSIYISVRRNFLQPMMLAFDTPSPASTMGKRNVSNVPAQALILMNDPFVVQQAQRWGKQLAASTSTTSERVTQMYLAAFARAPRAGEFAAADGFLKQQAEAYGIEASKGAADERVWADLAHVLFNVKEFIFIN